MAPIDFLFSGIDGFRRHRTGRHAALLAHYGFLSVFPLLLAITTVLGFLLQSRPGLRNRILDSAMAKVPIIGQTMDADPSSLHGNVIVLILGLAGSAWAGTRAFVVTQTAMNDIWEIPEHQRPNFARSRGRALLAVAVIGTAQIGTAIVTGFIGVSGVPWLVRILLAIAALVVNITVLVGGFRVLTARPLTVAQLLPGAIGAGIGFAVLQVVGAAVVGRAVANAAPAYGTFASVIGLITWFSLHATVALVGVEANAALDRRHQVALDTAAG